MLDYSSLVALRRSDHSSNNGSHSACVPLPMPPPKSSPWELPERYEATFPVAALYVCVDTNGGITTHRPWQVSCTTGAKLWGVRLRA